MELPSDATLLRVFLGESDRQGGQLTYEAIVLAARRSGLAGATVLRGPMGYGASSHLNTTKVPRLSSDLPVVVEIVDSQEKINAFLPQLDALMGSGLATLEQVKVWRYGRRH